MSICGSVDTTIPYSYIYNGTLHLAGTRYVILINGQGHIFSSEGWTDTNAWELFFFNAYLKDDTEALARLHSSNSVEDGLTDSKTHQRIITPAILTPYETFGIIENSDGGACVGIKPDFQIIFGSPHFCLVFPRKKSINHPDFLYDLQWSDDLLSWHTAIQSEIQPLLESIPDFNLGPGYEWSCLFESDFDDNETQRYYRLRVTGP